MSNYNSQDKMDVTAKRIPEYDNKLWVHVALKKSNSFIPSFMDIYRIIRAICHCEDEKYPNGEGAGMVKRFLIDTCDGIDFDTLRTKYKIPERD